MVVGSLSATAPLGSSGSHRTINLAMNPGVGVGVGVGVSVVVGVGVGGGVSASTVLVAAVAAI